MVSSGMSTSATMPSQQALSHVPSEDLKDYIILLKPRVMSLVVFTSLCGLLMAPGHIHPLMGFISILCIAIGAGASGCLNMWYDRDIDAVMPRTQNRPLPAGLIHPDNALSFGIILSVASVLVMGVAVGWLPAFWLAFTIGFYVLIYTMWLKRWTPQNIVIGGASGALPPLIGWCSVTGNTPVEAWILFLIIFLWTPPHFWALALHRNEDYQRANVPMLPVVSGIQTTKIQIFLYSLLLVGVTLVPPFIKMTTLFYGWGAGILGVVFIYLAVDILLSKETCRSMRLFGYSILYLFALFLIMTVDRVFVG